MIKQGNIYLWENGVPVSIAAKVRQVTDCAFIGHVYTPPCYRGKGYSTACTGYLSRRLLEEGFRHCALYADGANPCYNRVYQKLGYREMFQNDQYRISHQAERQKPLG